VLVDSNTVIRTLQLRGPQHDIARSAIKTLTARGEELVLTPQNLVEIWVVATRPEAYNGLGMNIDQASQELSRLKSLFNFIADTSAIHPVWESLVLQHRVSGKPAHDARLVAAMLVHGIESILTFNTSDFKRYPGIKAVNPAEVLSPAY
jgi:predicted nucleic acid-binding protein